jgi:alpha-beta hydrolase superfamily lysophospholipase
VAAAAASSSSSSSAASAAAQLPRLAALDRPQSRVIAAARAQPLQRLSWRVGPDACALEVWYRPPAAPLSSSLSAAADAADAMTTTPPTTPRPPVLLVHGLFRAAWSWEEAFLPALSASGRAAYAVSLRGQGASELSGCGGGGGNAQEGAAGAGAGTDVAAAVQEAGGVPMDVIMADLEAIVARVAEHHAEEVARARRWEAGGAAAAAAPAPASAPPPLPAPVLVGHSLGGMFVQEYLARLERAASSSSSQQEKEQQQEQQQPSSSSSSTPTTTPPPPPISGAALLASATAGTVMDFARFASDVGLPEFLWQMWIVATGQHLRDLSVARYCWWPDEQPQGEGGGGGEAGGEGRSQAAAAANEGVSADEARRWHALITSSSRACPYVRGEVARWNPPPRQQQQEAASSPSSSPFPPVLALGGARDRIIRPWQVAAARAHWGADVAVLPGLTHDVMLGPGVDRAFETLVAWLEQRVEQKRERVAARAP